MQNTHNKKLHELYFSPNIIKMMKSSMMRWAWHVARTGQMRNNTKLQFVNLKWSNHLGRQGIRGKIILKLSLKKQDLREWA